VCLKERKLGVSKPRLRHKGGGEVAIPAYEAVIGWNHSLYLAKNQQGRF
jgi:hypothetical protein